VRVALITEAAYPFRGGGASGWCHRLVSGLAGYDYRLVALTGPGERPVPAYRLPGNVSGLTAVPVRGAPATPHGRLARHRTRRAATRAAVLLCRGLLGDQPPHAAQFRAGLQALAAVASDGTHPLAGTPLADVLADAWRAAGGPAGRLSLRDAESAAILLEHAVRPLAVAAPPVDVCHPASGGLPLLVALATKWRAGIPYLLTEQGIYLRERYLDYGEVWPGPVKEVMLGFFRALSALGYAEAATVVPATRFDQRWQLQHGAHPAKVVVVPGGVDPADFPARPLDPEAGPVVAWLGRIEPLKDLHTLIRGFRRVHQELPAARLRLVGPTADAWYEASCRALVRRLGLGRCVTFAGPTGSPAGALADAAVVARSSISEGMPYPVLEAMMTGRPTVSTDVGGVAELVGDTGLVVPPGDPAALATGLLALLRDPDRRRSLGQAAARRARSHFPLDRMLRAYHQLYTDITPAPLRRSWSSLGVSPGESCENSMIDAASDVPEIGAATGAGFGTRPPGRAG
jgi:glycosyltransferase involved in cell wall biosynthesis